MRQRVVRPAEVVVDRQVAGGHVGQVLQQPQRRHLGHALAAPAGELELALLVETLHDPFGKLLGDREHVVGAEGDARPVRVDRAGLQAGVGQGQLGRGHAHLTLAAHHLQPLADRLLLLLLQRAEVVDLAGELPGLGAEADRQALGRAKRERAHAAAALREPFPQGLLGAAQRTDDPDAGDNDSSWRGCHAITICSARHIRWLALGNTLSQ